MRNPSAVAVVGGFGALALEIMAFRFFQSARCGLRVFCVILLVTFAGCRLEPREIEFVLPSGFRGPFILITRADGQSGSFNDGKLTLKVPESRILIVDDESAFFEMTRRSARFANGERLAIDNEVVDSAVALRGGGGWSGMNEEMIIPPHSEFFVGTEDDYENADYAELLRIVSRPRQY